MKRYLPFLKNEFANVIVHRGAVLVWMLSNIISLVVIVAVWQAAQAGQTLAGYSKAELVTYYLIAFFFDWVVTWLPFYGVSEQIRSGEIVLEVLQKPISLYWSRFFGEIGWHSFLVILGSLLTVLLGLAFSQYLILDFSAARILATALATILTIFVVFELSLCLGLLAFWFSDVWAVDSLFWAGRSLLGGQILPLSFIPEVFQTMVQFLPFRYTLAFPIEVYLGKVSGLGFLAGVLVALFWVVSFALLYKIMWERGRKVYSSFGQ